MRELYKVLITGSGLPFKDKEIEILKDVAKIIVDNTWEKNNILNLISEVDGLLIDVGINIDKEIISKAKKLKIIVEYGAGVDNVDIDAASRSGIYVCNLSDIFTTEVAEFTVSLMLCLIKELIKENYDTKKRSIWNIKLYNPLLMCGKSLGFIGYGKIAREVRNILENFKMEFFTYDPYINIEILKKDKVENCSLEELLRKSDIVSIHAPLTKETRNLINMERLNCMKKSSILINVSRGAIVDEKSLYEILNNRKIFGAAIDVLSDEPIKSDNPLRNLDNIIITPHIAWKSEFSIKNVEVKAAEKMRDFLLGKSINGIVNIDEVKK